MVIISPNCHAVICHVESTDLDSALTFKKPAESQICFIPGAKQDVPEVTISTELASYHHHNVTNIRVKLLI